MWFNKLKYFLAATLLISVTEARIINVPSDYRKIADALGNADAGDTIKVARGVYNENISLIQGVVVLGENPLTTILDGGRRGPVVYGVPEGEIQGFTIRNGIEGVLCENSPSRIINNWVIDNHATGIAAFISLPMIRNNVIYGNRWSGILAWGTKSYDFRIEHNVIMRNGYSGLTLMGPTNVVIVNNIIMENHYYGIFAEPAAGQTRVEYNNIFKNYYPFNAFVRVPRTNLDTEPRLINMSLAKPNFMASSKSPLKNRGMGKRDIGLIPADVRIDESEMGDVSAAPAPAPRPQPVAPPAPTVQAPSDNFVLDGIRFSSGSAEIDVNSISSLREVLDQMKQYPDAKFRVVGHTDSDGNRLKNRQLSKERAEAVRNWLVQNGIDGSRLVTDGRGQEAPIADNKTAAGREKNRRIEFIRIN
jgi:outer membrane protein OmpA-like peptidoglycan-associated protein